MAELKGNGLWDNIQSGTTGTLDKVLGPSYDYTQSIQTPNQKGVGEDGNVSQLVTNAFAVGDYVGDMTRGPGYAYGNATFVETGGMCKAPGGGVIPRWSYINNKLAGTDVLPPNLKRALGTGTFDGLIPGMFGDIAALNPLTLMNGLYMSGVPNCRAVSCPVTDANGTNQGQQTRFLVGEFEQNINTCRVAPANVEKDLEAKEVKAVNDRLNPPTPTPTNTEGFTHYVSDVYTPITVTKPTDVTPYILLGVAVLVIVCVASKKL